MLNFAEHNNWILQNLGLKELDIQSNFQVFSLNLQQMEILLEKGYLEIDKSLAPLNNEVFQQIQSLRKECEIEFKGYVLLEENIINIDTINIKGNIPRKIVEYWLKIILATKPKDFKISSKRISVWWSEV